MSEENNTFSQTAVLSISSGETLKRSKTHTRNYQEAPPGITIHKDEFYDKTKTFKLNIVTSCVYYKYYIVSILCKASNTQKKNPFKYH